jgi:hypothetical protein
MRRLGGRCQRGTRRCLWVNGEATTAEILEWAYPRGPSRDRRQRMNRARAVRHAAERIAVKVGRVWPGGGGIFVSACLTAHIWLPVCELVHTPDAGGPLQTSTRNARGGSDVRFGCPFPPHLFASLFDPLQARLLVLLVGPGTRCRAHSDTRARGPELGVVPHRMMWPLLTGFNHGL